MRKVITVDDIANRLRCRLDVLTKARTLCSDEAFLALVYDGWVEEMAAEIRQLFSPVPAYDNSPITR